VATVAPQVKPDRIGDDTGNDRDPEAQGQVEFACGRQSAGGEQPGKGREWQPHLLHEHRGEDERQAVVDKKLCRLGHY
jgi:hypothetical protein